jgi:chorismate mutase/prephenate dehydratase
MKVIEKSKVESSNKELENLRKKVDIIDDEIISLLSKRQALVRLIGEAKRRNSIKISSPERELQILERILLKAKKNVDLEFIHQIYRIIFKNSRKVQRSV